MWVSKGAWADNLEKAVFLSFLLELLQVWFDQKLTCLGVFKVGSVKAMVSCTSELGDSAVPVLGAGSVLHWSNTRDEKQCHKRHKYFLIKVLPNPRISHSIAAASELPYFPWSHLLLTKSGTASPLCKIPKATGPGIPCGALNTGSSECSWGF